MMLCHQKFTKQGNMCLFMTKLIENSVFAIFTRYENFASKNWYHNSVFYTTPHNMTQRHEIDARLR